MSKGGRNAQKRMTDVAAEGERRREKKALGEVVGRGKRPFKSLVQGRNKQMPVVNSSGG